MNVLITGAQGFIGKNLHLKLAEHPDVRVISFVRHDAFQTLPSILEETDFIFHLAGVNRPSNPDEFDIGNADFTQFIVNAVCDVANKTGKKIPIVFTSSIQAEFDSRYGASKHAAEKMLEAAKKSHGIPVYIFRLPNVFGKWCRPNYNSVVATFCYNISRGLDICINNPSAKISLVYIDDVVDRFVSLMCGSEPSLDNSGFSTIEPQYAITVGELARQIHSFRDSRSTLIIDRVGTGLVRALYSTYVSYLPPEMFSYSVHQHVDARGMFVEMLKTPDAGQFSFFTAHPGITRGGHYHHSKTEKFLVIKGQALFKFRHMQTGEVYEIVTSGNSSQIVETVPGWTHDITNIGTDEMVVMLWANEIFDRARPDTFSCPL